MKIELTTDEVRLILEAHVIENVSNIPISSDTRMLNCEAVVRQDGSAVIEMTELKDKESR